jgi:hypothetical protein
VGEEDSGGSLCCSRDANAGYEATVIGHGQLVGLSWALRPRLS